MIESKQRSRQSLGPDHSHEPFPREALDGTISRRFARMVERHGVRPAIEDGLVTLTYRELDAASASLAAAIRSCPETDAQPPEPVAILLDQGASFITALLGVLRAGRFPVPLDPRNPVARNRMIREDSQASLLVGNRASLAAAGALTQGMRVIDLDACPDSQARALPTADDPAAIATLLYTSGSTGKPKGVIQTHRTVLHNTMRHTNEFRILPTDRFSLLYPCGVYGGIRDIFNALLNGACLCRYPLEIEGLAPLGQWLVERRITIYCSVATLFRQFVRTIDDRRFPELRLIKLGGEVVFRDDVEEFKRCFEPGTLLSCGLAATEVGAVRQFFLDHETQIEQPRVPCGFPVEGVEVRIVDETGEAVAPGERGEIVVVGEYLSPGYWRRPELTARVFATDEPGAAMRTYRTGDLGFIREDGQLVHAGRKDDQVKIRGNRVEIPEVEAALLDVAAVREAVVTFEVDPDRGNRLHGFVVVPSEEYDEPAIRAALASRIPAFMIPWRFHRLERLELLPNGKIDRQRFAELLRDPVQAPTVDDRSELTPTTRRLTKIWDKVLERPVGRNEDFFEAGGDSLGLLQLMVLVEREFGRRFELNVILEAPTIDAMVARLESGGSPGGSEPTIDPITDDAPGEIRLFVVPIQPHGTLPPLFFVAPAGGTVLSYYLLAHLLGRDQPFYGLQVAPPERSDQPIDIPSIARRFLELIRTVQPRGPYRLGGWSFGGFVAWEMAAQARARALDVEKLIVIDSDSLIAGREPAALEKLQGVWTMAQMLWHSRPFLRNMLFVELSSKMKNENANAPSGWLGRLAWRAGVKNAEVSEVIEADPRLLDVQFVPGGRVQNMRAYIHAIWHYTLPELDQPVDLFLPDIECGRRERGRSAAKIASWNRYSAGRCRVHHIGGNHFTIFQSPQIQGMADMIREVLRPCCSDTGERPKTLHVSNHRCRPA